MSREYAAVTAHAWMDESGSGINHHMMERHRFVYRAVRDGIRAAGGTDDFLLVEVDGNELMNVKDAHMAPLDWPVSGFADLAQELGLGWPEVES